MPALPLAGVELVDAPLTVKPIAQGKGLALELARGLLSADNRAVRVELGPDALGELRDLIDEELAR